MRRVTIVGAGIAGLATAIFLGRAGFEVRVLERASEPPSEGAGIQISPNAAHVLGILGVLDALRTRSVAPDRIDLLDGARLLSSFELGSRIEDRYGAPYLVAARADLRDVLAAALPADVTIEYGRSFAEPVGLTIGADGVRSAVRSWIVEGAAPPTDTGWTAWRRTTSEPGGTTTRVRLSASEHRVSYPVPEGTNEVWVRRSDAEAPGNDWSPWPVLTVDPGSRWHRGQAVLIGDAAHAMPPYAAQGGAMALEDAALLAAALVRSPGDPGSAFEEYTRERRNRIRAIANLTEANRRIYHVSGPLRLARNLAMRAAPQAVLQRRMAWVYDWTPPTAIRSTSEPSR